MTDTTTKTNILTALRDLGLPEAWAAWCTSLTVHTDRPDWIRVNVYKPEPPERVVWLVDEDGDEREHTRTPEEMAAAWAEYGTKLAEWRQKYGDMTEVPLVSLNTSASAHHAVTLEGNGALLKCESTNATGPWRLKEWNNWLPGDSAEADGWIKTDAPKPEAEPRQSPPKPPCFISGPFRGASHWDIAENVRRAEALALAAWRSRLFSWVYCPHANTAHFQDAAPDEVWLKGHLEAMRAIHREGGVVLVVRDWGRSSGTRTELEEAFKIGMPAFEAQWAGSEVGAATSAKPLHRVSIHGGFAVSDEEGTLVDYLAEQAEKAGAK